MEWHDIRYCSLCLPLLVLPAGKCRVFEVWWSVSKIAHFGVEMGLLLWILWLAFHIVLEDLIPFGS